MFVCVLLDGAARCYLVKRHVGRTQSGPCFITAIMGVHDADKRRMDRFWGDRSWYDLLYSSSKDLFGSTRESRVASANPTLVQSYRKRLREVAGFSFVPEPVLMRNIEGGNLYYLFFASPNDTGRKIVQHIFDKYRTAGMVS